MLAKGCHREEVMGGEDNGGTGEEGMVTFRSFLVERTLAERR
jgi:hypothetical protein